MAALGEPAAVSPADPPRDEPRFAFRTAAAFAAGVAVGALTVLPAWRRRRAGAVFPQG